MESQVLEAIDAIRPALQADGGDISLVGIDEATGVVTVSSWVPAGAARRRR